MNSFGSYYITINRRSGERGVERILNVRHSVRLNGQKRRYFGP